MIITIVTAIVAPPEAKLRMLSRTEPQVELMCELSLEGFIIPLSYNLLLIAACLFYGFKTRKLPENFNESRYIFLCVCTTLFIWLAFIPTYFAAYHSYHKVVLLSLSLILNSSVMLLCLYVPKLYALFYVDEDNIVFTRNQATTSRVGPTPGSSTNARDRYSMTPNSTKVAPLQITQLSTIGAPSSGSGLRQLTIEPRDP